MAKVHALLITDTWAATTGQSVRVDLTNSRRILQNGLPGRLNLAILRDDDVKSDNIFAILDGFAVAPQDTLLCYYSGHGDVVDGNRHRFTLSTGEDVPRADVLLAMREKKARLTVLLSDCCSFTVPTLRKEAERLVSPAPVLEALLLGYRGVVDVNSCRLGERAVFGNGGGLFTAALCDYCNSPHPAGVPITWSGAFAEVANSTTEAAVPRSQHPAAFTPLDQVKPLAPSGECPAPAVLVVHLPADAKLTIDGEPTCSTGSRRVFVSPPLAPDRVLYYTLKAVRGAGGRRQSVTRQVAVVAGRTAVVHLDFAPAQPRRPALTRPGR
jgi:uncharacterized protein (TIGR03000 family)